MILVLDFGSQYSHLITRRIRELGVWAELVPHDLPLEKLKMAKGIILSGGPQNLSASDALRIDRRVFKLGIPILGICYGHQLVAYELGGKVRAGKNREYGPTEVSILRKNKLFVGLKKKEKTWMSHGDQVTRLPKGFKHLASSSNSRYAGMADEKRKIYGLQFHPEVIHTENGMKILKNFIQITKSKKNWSMKDFVSQQIKKIKNQVGNDKAICALSGGVDSAVAAALVGRAIGKRLTCIYVDTGLMREGETEQIINAFHNSPNPSYLSSRGGSAFGGKRGIKNGRTPSLRVRPACGTGREGGGELFNLKIVNARDRFLKALKGVTDPESKRKIIGELFIRVFEKEARRLSFSPIKFLVQGTLYTDAITSGVSVGKTAARIKSHHNVGGLPKKFGFKLIEPLRDLYKDEVRIVGRLLGLPKSIRQRQPFPGPGLAVRIIGEVSQEKLDLLKKADAIVREEIENSRLNVQQYFAVLPDIKSVGVQGDARTYGYVIIIRAVTTRDFMTADWAKLPYSLLEKISVRITNEIRGINRVVYDITSKPPATVEWE